MKNLKWFVLGLSVVGLAGLALSACGGASSCKSSSDCDGSKVCYKEGSSTQGQCVKSCLNDDSVCGSNASCEDIGDGVKGCVPGSGGGDVGVDGGDTGDTGPACMPACEAGETCQNGECVAEQNHKWVQIKDLTWEENQGNDQDGNGTDDAEDACNQDGATGSDLFAVELVDSGGQHLAWAQNIAVNTTATKSDGTKFTNKFNNLPGLNGEAPELSSSTAENACPVNSSGDVEFDGNIAALGCDGTMVVGFPKSGGGWWNLKESQSIRVYEYGQQCFQNCDPTENFSLCAIDYAEVKVCSASASKSDIEGGMPDGDRNYPGCAHSTTSFSSNGYGVGSPILPSGN